MDIYLTKNGQQLGPFTIAQLHALIKTGEAALSDFAWYEGLTDWIPLAQVPGMVGTTVTIDTQPKRPIAVWIICLLFFTCMPFGLFSLGLPTLMQRVPHLPPAQREYLESLGMFNYYLPTFINFVLMLTWAIQFFRLQRNSIYFLAVALAFGLATSLMNIFTSNWLEIINLAGIIGMIVGWGINLALLYYNWYLIQKGTLR